MKILRIALHNLASLAGRHTVDFTRDPLRAAGLFSISGQTGSGKSTLLDALCLALYDDTPRLREIGRLADLANGEKQNDPRNLLRRGTGEGSAEVAFVGVDGEAYTARWAVRRAHGKAEGTLQNAEMTLFRGNVAAEKNGVMECGGKKTEVLAAIAARIGLSFAQFTRAVLLAQNDFAAFLKADDKDRAEILQALTGTERFEAISMAVFARSSAEQRAVSDIMGRIEGNAPLAPEARMEAEAARARADAAWREAGEKFAAREAHALWFKRRAELSRQASEASVSLREKVEARDAAGPRRLALAHTEDASREARPLRDAEHRLRAETAAAEKSRAAAAKAEAAAQAAHAAKQKQAAEAATAFEAAKAALESAKLHLLQARELDAKLAPLADRLAAATRDRETAAASVKQVTADRDALRAKRTAAETERAQLLTKREALVPFAAFAPDVTAWLHRLDRAGAAKRALEGPSYEPGAVCEQVAATEAEIARLKIETEADARVFAELNEKRIPDAEKIAQAARRAFDLAAAAVADDAVRLREKLAPGQPCPVCGATDHPHSAHPPSGEAAALRALRADGDAKEAEAGALRETAARFNAARTTRLERTAEQSRALTTLHARRAAEKTYHAALGELSALFDGLAEARVAWDRDATAFRQGFADANAALIALEKRLGELAAAIREVDAALIPVADAHARAEADVAAKQIAETAARSACEAIRGQRAAIFAGRPAAAVETELAAALQRTAEARDLRAGELDKAGNQLTATAEARKSTGLALGDSASRLTAAIEALDSWLAGFAARIGRAFDRVELETLLARNDAWIKAERAALDAMESAISVAKGALEVHQKALADHAGNPPTTDDEPTVAAALAALHTACAEAGRRRDTARAYLLADDQRIASNTEAARQLVERQALAEPWLKLNELIGSADGAKFRGIAQRRTLDILLGYASVQLEQLAARYRLERLPESLNLIVIDRDMGDERRSVHSLSGGESFLVSLALALGLASLTSNRLRIESLFIDEGFGSLDPETLNAAMNALMLLEAQGRKVGVISHVTEMADAIPVQIRVVKGRAGASRLIVPGAAAELPCESEAEAAVASGAEGVAARILEILHRQQGKVSSRALRLEIGCDPAAFKAAQALLAGQIALDGKSLMLTATLRD